MTVYKIKDTNGNYIQNNNGDIKVTMKSVAQAYARIWKGTIEKVIDNEEGSFEIVD